MKMTISRRVMALALTLCLVLGMVPAVGLVQRVDSASNSWTKIAGGSTGAIAAETDTPFNASFANYVTGYYDQKIDVVDGTKISFKVNFPAITDGLLLQYCVALVDRAGSFYTSDNAANNMCVELVSTVSGGNANPLQLNASKKLTGASSRSLLKTITTSLSNPRNTTDVYEVTFEKINETEGSDNYSWKLTVENGSASYTYKYKASDIAHDLFKNGAYVAVGSMAGSSTHTVAMSKLKVTQPTPVEPDPTEPDPTEPTEPEPTEPEATEPEEEPQGWKKVGGTAAATNITADTAKPFNASVTGNITAYYDQKIDVEDGTKISFKVNFPTITDGLLLQYGFSLVNRAGSFYNSDTLASSLSVEMVSTVSGSTTNPLTLTASKKLAGGGRASLQSFASSLANPRNTTDVYTVTFEKINETVGSENYSWKVTVASGSASYTYKYKASDVAHDLFEDGLYLALGTMAGSSTHTVAVSDLTVTKTQPAPEPDPEPEEDPQGWNFIAGAKDRLTVDTEKPENATLTGYVTGYYNDKITVEENTTISFKVNASAMAEGASFHYGFSLMDSPKSFYMSDTQSNALSVELQSNTASGTQWPMRAVVSKKVAGGANRTWMANIPNPLAADRNTADVYTVTFQKINQSVENVDYSWKITVDNGSSAQVYLVKAADIAHDLFADGLYLAAGAMTSVSNHTVNITDLTVGKADPEPEPDPEPEEDPQGWNVVAGTKDRLTADSQKPENATLTNYVTGYYNNKITVEDGTTISFKVNASAMAEGASFHYGFSLMDSPKSFYTSDTLSGALSVELQSNTAVEDAWPMRAVVSKKVAGGANRTWMANIPNPLAADRNTTDVYTITFQKVSGAVDGVEYSWKITVNNGTEAQVYLVKASDIAHDLFADGLYLAAGAMTSTSNHTVHISDLTVSKEEVVLQDAEGWNAIAGAKDRLSADTQKPENATFTNYVTGYYNNKIDVADGTTISFDVTMPTMADGESLHYGFSLVDRAKSFYTSDSLANSMSVEIQSVREVDKKWPVSAVFSTKNAGGNRTWVANLGGTLASDREEDTTYTVTFQKINVTVDDINYSWYVTISDGKSTSGYGVKTTDVPHDRFANGAYLAAGSMTSVCNHVMKIANTAVEVSDEPFDTDKLIDLSGIWKIVRGYSGQTGKGLTMDDGVVTMEGYGGLAYMAESVTDAVAVEFELNKYPSKGGNFFSFGVVNKKGVYYNPNGKESQGIFVRAQDVNGVLTVTVYTVSEDGSTAIGNLTTTRKPKGTKHTLSFYESDGKWFVALDGQQKIRIDEPVDLEDVSYLVAGANTDKDMSMSVHNVYVDDAVTDAMKKGTLKSGFKVNGFQIVRGYGVGNPETGSGLTDKSGKTKMSGYGGIAYVDGTVKTAVAVDFTLNKYDAKGADFFSFGVVNKKGVYYNPDGSESQGIYVRIKPWVDGNGLNISVFNMTKSGSKEIGTLSTTVKAKSTEHTLAIFKENGHWYVGIDGLEKIKLSEKVSLGSSSYLVAGATMNKNMAMTVNKVYLNNAVTSSMKAGTLKAGNELNGFQVVRGYGKGSNTTGAGLSEKDGKTVMAGYGGLTYVDGKVKTAAAVDFEINAFEGNSYFFSFGVVNKKGVYYNPNGQESQGIYVRIKSWQNGQGMNVTVFNLTEAGSEELGTIVTNVTAKDMKHNIAFFQEDGVWYIGIDGYQKMRLDVEVVLEDTSYLVAGASGTADMAMAVHKVYLNDEVTDEMKQGTQVLSAVAGSEVGSSNTAGGTGIEKGEDQKFNTQDGITGIPDHVVGSTQNSQPILWILIIVAVAAVAAAAFGVFFLVKKKKEE